MKKKILAIALAAVMVFGITACSGEATVRDEGGATTEASASNKVKKDVYSGEQEIKIAYVAHDLSTPNNQAWLEGIQREIAPWSDHVTVQAFNGESSAETQVTIMTDIINQQYDAIILQCSDGTALADSVTQAEEAGIPVVTLNLDCTSVHSALVMAVDYDAGRMIADQIAEEIGGKGKVVIIEGVQGLTRTDNMERGFIETVEANYPDIEIIDKQSASFEKETAMTVMNSFLQNYDQIDAVFAINDAMAEGAALACQSAKKGDIIIWGADGEKDALEMIESGQMTGTIYTNSWDQGSTAAKIALLMTGSEYSYSVLSETPQVIMEPVIATKDTVGSISEEDRW